MYNIRSLRSLLQDSAGYIHTSITRISEVTASFWSSSKSRPPWTNSWTKKMENLSRQALNDVTEGWPILVKARDMYKTTVMMVSVQSRIRPLSTMPLTSAHVTEIGENGIRSRYAH